MKSLIALPLLAAVLASTPSGLVAGEDVAARSKIIQLGMSDGRIPKLATLDEFKSVAIPSQFGPFDNLRWATMAAIKPSLYEEIVPVYGYSTLEVCNSNRNDAANWDWGPSFATLAESLAQDLDPGALYVMFDEHHQDGGTARWYDSLKDACELSAAYQNVDWAGAKAFLNAIAESLAGQDMNTAFVTALPLWSVDAFDEYWAICNTENLSASADSACRMRLMTSPFKRHQEILAEPLQVNVGSISVRGEDLR